MSQSNIPHYLKRMIPSLLLMVVMTYGIKEGNPWIQYGSIALLLVGQMVYQGAKAMRSRSVVDANLDEARRASRRNLLLTVTMNEITKAKDEGKSIGGMSPKLSLLLVVPLAVFLATGYILSILVPGIPQWQSYVVGFLFTMPISLALQMKMGLGSTTPTANPNTYYVSEKGIVFEHMRQYYILHYPLVNLEVKQESNCIEIEGQPTNAPMIPNKVRLFNRDVKKLQRLLTRFTEK